MPTLLKKRLKKVGLPPGTLVHIGEKKVEKTIITLFNYDELHFLEKVIKTPEECLEFKDKLSISWINVEGIHETEIVEKIGKSFGVHLLAMEDILNTDQRPKIEDFDKNLFIVLKMLTYNDLTSEIVTEQVSLILGSNFLISFQEGIEGDVFNPIRERIRGNKGKIRKMGADYLLYRLTDAIIDNYFIILEKTGGKIEALEAELLTNITPETMHKIHHLKRELIFLRKSVWPLREIISWLLREETFLIKQPTRIFFRDVYDHTIQVMDSIETFRDMLSSMLDIYLSNINNKINTVMKFLTSIATIFMPPTFIVGIYGMNFKHMPELDWEWGYPFVMILMATIATSMLIYFKKKKWI